MALLLLLLVALACIWGLNLAIRGSMLTGCALYLIVAGAIGYEYLHFSLGGISGSLDRILLVGLLGAYVIQWKLGRTAPKTVSASELVLLAFFGLLLANTWTHEWNRRGPDQVPIIPHLIEGYLIPLILYWMARRAALHEREVNYFYALFALFGIYLSLTAICEIAGAWSLVFPKIIGDPTRGIHFGRARGPFLQSVRLGLYLLAGLAAIWIPLVWRGVWGRAGQLFGFCLAPLFLVALLLTYTRSIWLGTGLASIVLFALTLQGRLRRLAFLSMLGGALAVLAVVGHGFVAFQREYGAAETQESTEMRAVFAYVSWLMFQEKPIAGYGFGHYPHENRPFLNDRQTPMYLGSIRGYIHHNTFLSLLVELGIFGLLLYVAVLISWWRLAWWLWRDRQAPPWMRGQSLMLLLFLPHFVVQMLFHDVTYSPLENGLLYLVAGLTSGMAAARGLTANVFRSPQWAARFAHPFSAVADSHAPGVRIP